MRGYGTLQTMTALEVQVDEICRKLPLDPIEFRRRNALATGNRNTAGNPYVVSIRTPEILDKLEKHPIWARREQRRRAGSSREFSSVPASRASPRTTAPEETLAWDPSKSLRTVRLPSIATAPRWGTALGQRWPIGLQRI